jgi:hypothetical protein
VGAGTGVGEGGWGCCGAMATGSKGRRPALRAPGAQPAPALLSPEGAHPACWHRPCPPTQLPLQLRDAVDDRRLLQHALRQPGHRGRVLTRAAPSACRPLTETCTLPGLPTPRLPAPRRAWAARRRLRPAARCCKMQRAWARQPLPHPTPKLFIPLQLFVLIRAAEGSRWVPQCTPAAPGESQARQPCLASRRPALTQALLRRPPAIPWCGPRTPRPPAPFSGPSRASRPRPSQLCRVTAFASARQRAIRPGGAFHDSNNSWVPTALRDRPPPLACSPPTHTHPTQVCLLYYPRLLPPGTLPSRLHPSVLLTSRTIPRSPLAVFEAPTAPKACEPRPLFCAAACTAAPARRCATPEASLNPPAAPP